MKKLILDFDATLLHLQADWTLIRGLVRQALAGVGLNYDTALSMDANLFKLRLKHEPLFFETMDRASELERVNLESCRVNGPLLRRLRDTAAPFAIFTSNAHKTARAAFASGGPLAGLRPELIVGKDDVMNPKPAPDGAVLILKKLNWSRDEVLYLGDSKSDVDAAAAAGVKFELINEF